MADILVPFASYNEQANFYTSASSFTILETEYILGNAVNLTNPEAPNLNKVPKDIYEKKGKTNPEEESVSLIIDEALKQVLVFTDSVVKQLGVIAEQELNKQVNQNQELTLLVMVAVNAIFGIATGGFSFNIFSILGSVLSVLGFSGLGSLLSTLGGALGNTSKEQEQHKKIAESAGKRIAQATKSTLEVVQNPEGLIVNESNFNFTKANAAAIETNVSLTYRSPMITNASDVFVVTTADFVNTSNYYQAHHNYYTVVADNAYSYKTRHSTRYHSVSVVEIASQADYIAGTLTDYADFRWTQTGQGIGTLPITNPLSTIINSVFTGKVIPITGVNIDMTTYAKLTTSQFLNMNYSRFYTIDGITLINCGFGAGLGSIPPRQVNPILDITPPSTVDRPSPEAFASINNKTYETMYKSVDKFEGINLGQLITKLNTVEQDVLLDKQIDKKPK